MTLTGLNHNQWYQSVNRLSSALTSSPPHNVHPVIHHTPNVKLITVRGHGLARSPHEGTRAEGVRKSAPALEAAGIPHAGLLFC